MTLSAVPLKCTIRLAMALFTKKLFYGVHEYFVFQEVIYQRCLAIELRRAGLDFEREKEQNIYYEEFHVGTRRADFIVENKVVVELKAVIDLEDVHLAQAKNYVVAYQFAKGLLINFGAKSLQYKLIFNPHLNSANS